MFNSIENRSPFLDKDLVEFMYTVPTNLLMEKGFTKSILRQSMRGIVLDNILNEKKSQDLTLMFNLCLILIVTI